MGSFLSGDQDNRYTLIVSIFATNTPNIIIIMKIAICFACVVAMATAESWMAAPYTLVKRAAEPQNRPSVGTRNNNPNTRFFTGNGALDAGLAVAAAGVAGQYITTQIFNPCRNRNRNNNRGQTNNRIFGGNTGNFLLGAAGGFAGASLANNIFGNPCGR